jgi:hypothetical protein
MMRARQRYDQRRLRERRRLARIAVLKEGEAGLSPTSFVHTATARPPQPARERRGRRVPLPTLVEPIWSAGDKVHWRGYIGFFLQEDDDGYAEVLVGTRTYRVRKAELRSA